MNKTKPQPPILKLVLPSPWLEKTVNGIEYWVHIPTRRCGIHIHGEEFLKAQNEPFLNPEQPEPIVKAAILRQLVQNNAVQGNIQWHQVMAQLLRYTIPINFFDIGTVAGLTIIVIVASQIPAAPHNLPWNLLSYDPELIRYALDQSPLPENLRRYFEPKLIS